MDLMNALFFLFAMVSTLYVTHIGFYLIGANFYDIWQLRRLSRWRKLHAVGLDQWPFQISTAPNSSNPLVTVAIPAHNETKVIGRCLDSIRQSRYRPVQVIVADDASRDCTKQLVRDYMLRHPDMDLQVYRMRKNCGKGTALSTVLRRHARGTFAMMIDADSVISPDAIVNALTYFDDPAVAGVAANVQIIFESTVLGVLQKFEHMLGYRAKKLYTFLNSEFVVGGVASTYRMDILRKVDFYDSDSLTEDIGLSMKIVSLGNKAHRMIYGSDVVAMTEGVPTFKALARQRYRWKFGSLQCIVKHRSLLFNLRPRDTLSMTVYRLPLAMVSEIVLLTTPLAWAYAFYMAFHLYSLGLVAGAYLTITAYTLVAVWFDENLRPSVKLQLTLYAPVAYFVYYVMELIQLLAILRSIGNIHILLRKKNIGAHWVSPERTGKKLAANEI